jgi:hypothetical protein
LDRTIFGQCIINQSGNIKIKSGYYYLDEIIKHKGVTPNFIIKTEKYNPEGQHQLDMSIGSIVTGNSTIERKTNN